MSKLDWTIHKIHKTKFNDDFTVTIWYENGLVKSLDMKPRLNKELFKPLNDLAFFKKGRKDRIAIAWPGAIDLSPYFVWEESSFVRYWQPRKQHLRDNHPRAAIPENGIIIELRYRESNHHLPHVHVITSKGECSVSLSPVEIIAGNPGKGYKNIVKKLIIPFASDLEHLWYQIKQGDNVDKSFKDIVKQMHVK